MPYGNQELWQAIEAVNQELLDGEPGNMSKADQQGNQCYQPQHLLDAVNQHLGPENWRETIQTLRLIEATTSANKATHHVEITMLLEVRVNGEWIAKSPQFGFGRGDRDENDAKKAAVSDARKKNFTAWSIGGRPYRGEMKGAARPSSTPSTPSTKSTPSTPSTKSAPPPPRPAADLPPMTGDASLEMANLIELAAQAGFPDLDTACGQWRRRVEDLQQHHTARVSFAENLRKHISKIEGGE